MTPTAATARLKRRRRDSDTADDDDDATVERERARANTNERSKSSLAPLIVANTVKELVNMVSLGGRIKGPALLAEGWAGRGRKDEGATSTHKHKLGVGERPAVGNVHTTLTTWDRDGKQSSSVRLAGNLPTTRCA
uniref:Uncharacterized protein n=1 Tax=Plectus sambesii TaxID=2011161 RepID=A0A914W359_9BILA